MLSKAHCCGTSNAQLPNSQHLLQRIPFSNPISSSQWMLPSVMTDQPAYCGQPLASAKNQPRHTISVQEKGHLHRWDFEMEEERARYNDQTGAMLKAAFQFGVKMQDGRKTRRQNKDQKITNELHKINKILARKKMEKGEDYEDGGHYDDDLQPGKKLRI